MKKRIIVLVVLLLLVSVFSGCIQRTRYVCPDGMTVSSEYMCESIKENSYCGDKVCDDDENWTSCVADCPKEYEQFRINVMAFDTYDTSDKGNELRNLLDANPAFSGTIKLRTSDEEYYQGAWLCFYTSYLVEDVRCEVKEYYGSEFNSQFTLDLNVGGLIIQEREYAYVEAEMEYQKDIMPSKVRYDYTCKGTESGNQYVGSYTLNLEYNI